MSQKVKVKLPDGKEVEADLPDGYLSPDEAKALLPQDAVEQIVKGRLAQAQRSSRKVLAEDPDFIQEILSKHGKAAADGSQDDKSKQPNADAVAQAVKDFEKTRLTPVMQELDGLKGKLAKMQTARLHSDILAAAAAAGVKPAYLKSMPGGGAPMIVGVLGEAFGFDDELGEWLVRNPKGDGWAVSGRTDAAHPWKGVRDYFTELAKDKEFAEFFTPSGQPGPGVRQPAGSTASTVVNRNDPLAFGLAAADILSGKATVE